MKQEVSLKKTIVEGYRAVGSLNDSFQSSNFLLLCCFLLISVSGKTYKSAIKRLIKIRTHHVKRKYTHRLTNEVMSPKENQSASLLAVWARGYKTFSMLNSAEHEIFKCSRV